MSSRSDTETRRWIVENARQLPVIADPATPGWPVDTPEAEDRWLPILGPTTICLWRRLARVLDGRPSGLIVDLAEWGPRLGVGRLTTANAPIVGAVERLVRYRHAEVSHGALVVAVSAPELSVGQRSRLVGMGVTV